ncbi:MAG: cell division protein CrgA, partial [Acidothermus cellulolyticus]|nr:cell division protein CrgA [Acidothermus cellulolyticus]
MPKSRVRKTVDYIPPPTRSPKKRVSPPWLAPTMVACLIVGVIW